jgi:hypothetical protein
MPYPVTGTPPLSGLLEDAEYIVGIRGTPLIDGTRPEARGLDTEGCDMPPDCGVAWRCASIIGQN